MTDKLAGVTDHPAPPPGMGARVVLALGLWATVVGLAGITGAASALPTQMIAPLVALAIAAPMAVYVWSPGLRAWCAHLGLWWLTAFHGWRIAAAGVFFWYGQQGLLPAWFVTNAGWGDLAAGLLALTVVAWPSVGRRGYWLAHGFGFADFVVAVGTGLTYTLIGDPLMDTISTFPLILIPLFMVGVSGAVHLIAFHLLWTGRGGREG
jgi:hypothetical protein